MTEQTQTAITFDEMDALIDRALSSGPPTQLEMVSIRQIALKVEQGRQAARATDAGEGAEESRPDADAAPSV